MREKRAQTPQEKGAREAECEGLEVSRPVASELPGKPQRQAQFSSE